MGELSRLPGLGPKSEQWLNDVGIDNEAQLKELGAINAFLRLERGGHRPSLNFLYALAGALDGVHWARVARTERGRLLMELEDAREFEARSRDSGDAG